MTVTGAKFANLAGHQQEWELLMLRAEHGVSAKQRQGRAQGRRVVNVTGLVSVSQSGASAGSARTPRQQGQAQAATVTRTKSANLAGHQLYWELLMPGAKHNVSAKQWQGRAQGQMVVNVTGSCLSPKVMLQYRA